MHDGIKKELMILQTLGQNRVMFRKLVNNWVMVQKLLPNWVIVQIVQVVEH
jgi:hypothetical protein